MPARGGRVAAGALFLLAAVTLGAPAHAGSPLGPATPHLAVVVLENKETTDIVGAANAPYINGTLIPSGRLFTAYWAALRTSLPNYLVLTSGRFGTCVTDGCARDADPAENLFHQMNTAGPPVTWKVYAGGMPSNCYKGNSGAYAVRHNPPPYYSNIGPSGDGSCSRNDVPYTRLASDISANALPAFSLIVPNLYDDMHSDQNQAPCQLGSALQDEICQGDTWLQANLPALLSDGGRNDVTVMVVFDEGSTGQGGGGHVMLVEVGPTTCTGCTDARPFNHYGLLNAVERWFGLPELHPDAPSL